MCLFILFLLLFLSRCAGTSSAVEQLRGLTGKSALETATCQELEIWYYLSLSQCLFLERHIFVILYGRVGTSDMRPNFNVFLDTSIIWRMCAEGGGPRTQPEVYICCSSLQQPGQATWQLHRRDNIPATSIHANITALNMGSLGTGTLHTHALPDHSPHLLGPCAFSCRKQDRGWSSFIYSVLRWHFKQSNMT